jgi:hypothetical protein
MRLNGSASNPDVASLIRVTRYSTMREVVSNADGGLRFAHPLDGLLP